MLAAEEVPKITDWMQAWGSIAGLLLSGLAALATWLLLRHEIKVRREEKADAEAAQARLVIGQVASCDPIDWPSKLRWRVSNHSSVPIYDIEIKVDDRWRDYRVGVVWDAAEGEIDVEAKFLIDMGMFFDPREVNILVEFTDASGLRWERLNHDPPKRLLDFKPSLWQRIRHRNRKVEPKREFELDGLPPF